ncbi:hypothetical protein K2173_019850 [Erythroxylum novogranatense]|uniref:Uncharacterized protein n=1 Tax=Erythroxylum novogranatense TaxID=1862640 RepID=A0AAV8SN75_9ROSI|nr:hypothetical protein K2173_019850 [Erythroxylum novogranatense]
MVKPSSSSLAVNLSHLFSLNLLRTLLAQVSLSTGYLRVFDYSKEQLFCGGKSYYGALLCCAWSMDGKYILAGGEDDLVQVWSMEDRKVVAWGEGHNSWVSGVAFDSYWSSPNSDGTGESVMYRFGSVGQIKMLATCVIPSVGELIHNSFCGTWKWMKLLFHFADALLVDL